MKIVYPMLVVLLFVAYTQVTGQEQAAREVSAVSSEKKPELGEPVEFNLWMDAKLKESQNVLAGLARGDFPAIAESARQMKTLSKIEAFVRKGMPGYRTQLRSFEFAVVEIESQAKKENIEGVALGFQQLTLSCVNCHKQLREPILEKAVE